MTVSLRIHLIIITTFVTALVLGQACSESRIIVQDSESSSSFPILDKTCIPPNGISGSPKTIEDAVDLINALPRPVTVPCFLESLDRPLGIALSSNTLSAQPAQGARSPRVFIFSGDLIISAVPDGPGTDLIEFGLLTAPDRSIKAEIEFPVTEELSYSSPYERIRFGTGTSCLGCHAGESRAFEIPFAEAFSSRAIQPIPQTRVSLDAFKKEYRVCDPKAEPERCEILRALFGYGQVLHQSFPAEMPFAM